MHRIIILHEKHGDRYFYIPDEETLYKTALYVVKEKQSEGYYEDLEYLERPLPPETSEDEIKKLKEGRIKFLAEEEWEKYKSNLKYYEDSLVEKELLLKVVSENDGKLALKFLRYRKQAGLEYEDWIIEECEEISN